MNADQPQTGDLEKRSAELQRENEALLDKLQDERTRTAALGRALEMVRELSSRQRLLDLTVEGALELIGAEAASIVMVSKEDPSVLKFESARGEKARDLGGYTLRQGEGIVGWVIEQGIAQIVPDAAKDPRFLASLAGQIDYRVNNVLCVPVRKAGVVVGALELLNKGGGRPFNALDVEVAEIFASQAGTLLQVAEQLVVGEH